MAISDDPITMDGPPTGAGDESRLQSASLFAAVLYWVMVAAVALSNVGLILAIAEVFYPVTMLAIGVPAAIGLGWAGWRPFRRSSLHQIHGGILPVAVVIIVLLASGASAAIFSGEHLPLNRDPAAYLSAGRWLADEGTVLVPIYEEGFAEVDEFSEQGPGFLHLLPVWGAAAHWIGGDQALLRVNALAIVLALAAVWLFAASLMRPWFAVLATAAVAVILPTVHLARDLYSEPLALLFAFGGLAFLGFARSAEHRVVSVITGLMVGTATMARIDGWLIVIAVVAYLMAVWWTAQQEGADGRIGGFVHPVLLGILISGSVSLVDGLARSMPYFTDHKSQIATMFALLVGVMAMGIIALKWPEPIRLLVGWLADHRRALGWLIPVTIVVAAASLFFVRPLVQEVHGPSADPAIESLQQLEGLEIDGTRTYAEWAVRWLSWYLGWPGLALAVIGLAWAWRAAILGRARLWPFLLVVSLATAVYMLRPSITPDQLWATRRFLPVVLPGLILAAVLAVQWATERISSEPGRRAALAFGVVILLVVPASYTWPLRSSTSFVGMYDGFQELCVGLPEGSAVLVTKRFAFRYQAPLRAFCGVPVAAVRDPAADLACVVATANRAWAARGVDLKVLYRDELDTPPAVAVDISYDLPEFTLTRRPDRLVTQQVAINLADADAIDASACAADG